MIGFKYTRVHGVYSDIGGELSYGEVASKVRPTQNPGIVRNRRLISWRPFSDLISTNSTPIKYFPIAYASHWGVGFPKPTERMLGNWTLHKSHFGRIGG